MNKQCTNCPGRTDHTTAQCPIRARFEAYMLGREHPVIGWIDAQWFRRGDDPATYANDYVQGCWVMWQARASLPVGVPDALEQARRHLSNAIEDAEDGKAAAALPALREVAHYLAQAAAPTPNTMGTEDICGKYSNVLRPFMAMMEAELHANTGKGDRPGWLAMSPEQCLLEIYYHTAKLQKAVKNNDMKGVREHTADVANMSMMLADTCGWLDVVSAELASGEQKSMAELISQHRIAITPEYEGQWHADLYGSEAEPLARAEGATPEAAVAAVVALFQSLQEQQP